MKLKILCQPHDEVLMMTDSQYKIYKANEDRIILKDRLLLMNYLAKQAVSNTTGFSSRSNWLPSSPQLAWRTWKAPRNCQIKNCLQGKILFFKNGAIDQGVRHVM